MFWSNVNRFNIPFLLDICLKYLHNANKTKLDEKPLFLMLSYTSFLLVPYTFQIHYTQIRNNNTNICSV